MAVKFFKKIMVLLKVDHFEGFSNRCKIDGMMNDNSSSCNSFFIKIEKDHLQ